MAKRYRVNPRIDRAVFSNTAISKKRINLEPVIMRGGERL